MHGLLRAVDVAAERAGEDRDRAAELGAERAGDRLGRGLRRAGQALIELHDRPQLDLPVLRARALVRPLDGLVEVLDVEQVVAAELLLVSANGPSVTSASPPSSRTTVWPSRWAGARRRGVRPGA